MVEKDKSKAIAVHEESKAKKIANAFTFVA